MTDTELIEAWAERRSESAFSELVHRYVNLVYGSALRQVGDPQLAEEVAQAVFLVLARKASSLSNDVILSGWFFRTTRFIAARALRGETRRRHYEQRCAAMTSENSSPQLDDRAWSEAAPMLDEAIASLQATDRNAVLLRFFQEQPMRAVGEELGVSEDAAKKRVSRAVERLRDFFVRRGVALSVAGVGAILTRSAAQGAPVGLTQSILLTQTDVAASASVAGLVTMALRQLFWLKLRLPIGIGAAAVAALLVLKLTGAGNTEPIEPLSGTGTTAKIAAVAEALQTGAGANARPANARVLNAATQKLLLLGLRSASDEKPIVGAKILLDCWGSAGAGVVHSMDLQSNTNGICEIPVPAVEFDTFRLWVSADGFVPEVLEWKSYELEQMVTSYTTKLERGLKIEGVVQDDLGSPLPGATIRFGGPGVNTTQRENVAFHKRLSGLVTDSGGRFTGNQMPSAAPLGMSIVVTHAEFAAQWLPVIIPEGLQTNWLIVLNRGASISGRVVSDAGAAVGGSRVIAREPHGAVDAEAKTDGDGQFMLAHMPAGTLEFQVSAAGFKDAKKTVEVESNALSLLFPLKPALMTFAAPDNRQPIRFNGTVVDAETEAPISRFKVLLDERRGTSRDLLGEGHQGAFDWENPLAYVSEYTLEVDADGYEPQVSSIRKRADGNQSFEFRLSKGGLISGQILQPDGHPASGAKIGLQNDRLGLRFQPPAKFVNYGHPVNEATADAEGQFSINAMAGMEFILVVHESGCAALPAASKTNLSIQLQAWGAVEGIAYIGNKPSAADSIGIGFQSTSYAPDLPRIPFDLTVKTDGEGHFRFDRVPPGTHTVYRYVNPHPNRSGPIGFSHQEIVSVSPGETARVSIGGKGRKVVGRFVLSPPLSNYDWGRNLIALTQNRPDLAPPKMGEAPGDGKFFRLWGIYEASIAKYYLEIRSDGSFEANDVLPGEYILAVSINEPPADPANEMAWLHPGPVLGAVTNTILVPILADDRTQSPLDLGSISIPISNSASRTASMKPR